MSKKSEALATVPVNADKEARKRAIDEAVNNKKKTSPVAPPERKSKTKIVEKKVDEELDENVRPKKKEKDPNMLSVSDIAREVGIDPKRARARLRGLEESPIQVNEGRWPLVKRDSKQHRALIAILAPVESEDDEDEEESDEDEE